MKVVDLSRPFCPIYNLFYIVYYNVEGILPFKVIVATLLLVARVLCTSRGIQSNLEGMAMHTRVVSTSRGNRPNKEIVATTIVLIVIIVH